MQLKMLCLALAFSAPTVGCAQTPPPALVALSADDPSAGAPTWRNGGTLGDFTRLGSPQVVTLGGVKGVMFDGVRDAYVGPKTPPALEGHAPRSIEVWAYNPSVDSVEETVVSWGRRGGPAGTAASLNWGSSPDFGAATHWASDLGWNGVPKAGQWHLLAYTYDGKTARVYDNGVEKNARDIALDTASGFPVTIAAQNGPQGSPSSSIPATARGWADHSPSRPCASCRTALTPAQVEADFAADAAAVRRGQAVQPPRERARHVHGRAADGHAAAGQRHRRRPVAGGQRLRLHARRPPGPARRRRLVSSGRSDPADAHGGRRVAGVLVGVRPG